MSIKLFGHRAHPMLVTFPIGLLGGSVGFDIAFLATNNARWADISFWMLATGIVSGLVAAPFGSLDWLKIASGTRAKRIGLYHGVAAITSVAICALSVWLRYDAPTSPEITAIIVSFAGVAVLLFAGWLGGELVERLGVGVDPGAHLNSPSSLSGRPAEEVAGEVGVHQAESSYETPNQSHA